MLFSCSRSIYDFNAFSGSTSLTDPSFGKHGGPKIRVSKHQSSSGCGSLKIRCNKPEMFITSCVDIANTLESRLRSDMIKREEQKIWEVRLFFYILNFVTLFV